MFRWTAFRRVSVTCFMSALALCATSARSQDWPNKPIKVIVSFAQGGLTDLIARSLQSKLQEGLGQPIVIENRPGAGGTLAEGLLAKAAPDGYTILLSADSVPANPHLVPRLPYDTLKDLQPVSMLARIPLVLLVSNNTPVNNVKDFVRHAKAQTVSYGSPGIGTSNHLYFELFTDNTGLTTPHIAYKGGGQALTDLMGDHIQALMLSVTLAGPQVTAGKVKALAVTSDKRLARLPNVPTFEEAGFPDFKPQQWTGLFVPSGTPAAIVARIRDEFSNAIKSPEVMARLAELNVEPVTGTQAEFTQFLQKETQVLGRLIKAKGITAQ